MEDTLRAKVFRGRGQCGCLNPCFNGRYSQRLGAYKTIAMSVGVLILVLMEDTLRDQGF